MTQELKNIIFSALEQFNNEQLSINWQAVLDNEELMQVVDEIKNRIMHNYALTPGITPAAKEALLGKLAVTHAQLADAYGNQNKEAFFKAGNELENLIRQVLKSDDILTHAKKRYDEYAKIELLMHEGEEPELSQEKLDYLRPVFLSLDVFALITIETSLEEESQEALIEDENEDDYEFGIED
jgi:hypothetical protein